jgi:hypothetical protein
MNPNLRYAQAVLGVNEGRGTGIIDLRDVPSLLDAASLIETSPSWTMADRNAFRRWCTDYLAWLRTSANGRDEGNADNNHGTWYDAQVAALALFVRDTALARQTIGTTTRQRIAMQIRPDGSMPLELARTRPLHYSLFNLDAFTQLAEMGRHVGVDLWHYVPPSGGGIVAALRSLAPYADASHPWPTAQVTPATPDVFLPPLAGRRVRVRGAIRHVVRAAPRLDRVRHRLEAEAVVIGAALRIDLAIAPNVRQPTRLRGVGPPVRREAHEVVLVAARRSLALLHHAPRSRSHRRVGGEDECVEGGTQRGVAGGEPLFRREQCIAAREDQGGNTRISSANRRSQVPREDARRSRVGAALRECECCDGDDRQRWRAWSHDVRAPCDNASHIPCR